MMNKRVVAMAICMAVAVPALAQPGMDLIGEREVADGVDHDTISARGSSRQYREIMICIEQAPVNIQEVVVHFRNGGIQNMRLRSRIAANRCGRVIGLSGRDRDIVTADFTYQAVQPGGPHPKVQLYGR